MAIDIRVAQTTLENALRDAILFALGRRQPKTASAAALRLVKAKGAGPGFVFTDDALAPVVVSNVVTAQYRWSSSSTATDDGATAIQPADVSANGRWLLWTSPLRFSTQVGGDSALLHQIATGPLQRVILLDREQSEEDLEALIAGQLPAVIITATGDEPEDLTMDGGSRWSTAYRFDVAVVSQNLRDRREAAQGSALAVDAKDPGANALDGFVKALLSGTQLSAVVEGIREIKLGSAENWISEGGQRRVIRSREYKVLATEYFPMAPNETTIPTDVMVQAHLTAPDANEDSFDPLNYVSGGMAVPIGNSLTQSVSAGTAVIAGLNVSYAGASHAFPPYSDTYRDLNPNGTMTFTPVGEDAPAPEVPAGALRIGVTRTYASAVVSDRILAAFSQTLGPRWDFPIP